MNLLGLGVRSMRGFARTVSCLSLVSVGYVIGALHFSRPASLRAEPQSEGLPNPIRDRLRETNRVLAESMQVLMDDRRYVPAIQGLNAFAISAGGVDAIADLESGQGVDPETFAGIYAGQALAEVAEHIRRDAEGHMTYKNKIVRLYSPTRLKELFAARAEFAPVGAGTSRRSVAPKKEKEKETEEAPEKSEKAAVKSKDE
jgi:hypothetical protein